MSSLWSAGIVFVVAFVLTYMVAVFSEINADKEFLRAVGLKPTRYHTRAAMWFAFLPAGVVAFLSYATFLTILKAIGR